MKKCVAVIEIASNEIRLKIGEKGNKKVKVVESVSNPLSLGKDTFHSGIISFDSIEKLSAIINGYKLLARDYGVKEIYAFATTAVRESKNRDFFVDQIKVKTGIDVEVIDGTEEKIYINKMVLSFLSKEEMDSTLIAHLGSGNISITIFKDCKAIASQNIQTGALRISEFFDSYRGNASNYLQVIKEYLKPFQDGIGDFVKENFQKFVITGNQIESISSICKAKKKNGINIISREDFLKLYKEVRDVSPVEIAEKYGIEVEKAEVILPAIIIYSRILKFTNAKSILSPIYTVGDAILYEILFPYENEKINKGYEEFSIISAKNIAKKFSSDENYFNDVSRTALEIFDKMKKHHGLGERDRLMLNIAAILEDIGKAVNITSHDRLSYHMIKGLDIVGINDEEKQTIASISYYHNDVMPFDDNGVYLSMDCEKRVRVCKLSAILKLANAVYTSHNNKFESVNVKCSGKELIVTISTYKNIDLEKWAFKKRKQLFEDVYGIKAVLNKRSVMWW